MNEFGSDRSSNPERQGEESAPAAPPTVRIRPPGDVAPAPATVRIESASPRHDRGVQLAVGDTVAEDLEITAILSTDSGEAAIYQVRDPQGELSVLKLYRPNHEPQIEVLQSLKGFHHEDVLLLIDFGYWNSQWYELNAYAAGGTLADRIPFSDEELLDSVVPQMLNGLSVLHDRGIIHRDIKPVNLFYLEPEDEDLVIGDFGASRYKSEESDRSVLMASSMFGTVGFMAPEASTGAIGTFTDYFALGMTLLQLRGTDPVESYGSWAEWNLALIREEVDVRAMVPERIGELIDGLLVTNPRHRWGRDEVERWLAGESVPVQRGFGVQRGLKWRGAHYADNAAVAEMLYEGSESAVELVASGSLKEWLLGSKNEIETWDSIRAYVEGFDSKEKQAASSREWRRQWLLRRIAFTLDHERPFLTLDGRRCQDLREVYDEVDAHFDDYMASSERSTFLHQLQLFVLIGRGGAYAAAREAGTAFASAFAEVTESCSDEPFLLKSWKLADGDDEFWEITERAFFTRFLYHVDPQRQFRIAGGDPLKLADDPAEALKTIARAIDRDRESTLAGYRAFRIELLAMLEARGWNSQREWFLVNERAWKSDGQRLLAFLHYFDPDRGFLTARGEKVHLETEAGCRTLCGEILRHSDAWVGNEVARAELQTYAHTRERKANWIEIEKLIHQDTRLGLTTLRSLAISLLRPYEKLGRVEIVEGPERTRLEPGAQWQLRSYSTLADYAQSAGIAAPDELTTPHQVKNHTLDLDVRDKKPIELPWVSKRKMTFDSTLADTIATITRDRARLRRQLGRERTSRSIRVAVWRFAPAFAGLVTAAVVVYLLYRTDAIRTFQHTDGFWDSIGPLLGVTVATTLYPILVGLLRAPALDSASIRTEGFQLYLVWIILCLTMPFLGILAYPLMWLVAGLGGLVIGIFAAIFGGSFGATAGFVALIGPALLALLHVHLIGAWPWVAENDSDEKKKDKKALSLLPDSSGTLFGATVLGLGLLGGSLAIQFSDEWDLGLSPAERYVAPSAEQAPLFPVTIVHPTTIRARPSNNGAALYRIEPGEVRSVLAIHERWYAIRMEGGDVVGFIHSAATHRGPTGFATVGALNVRRDATTRASVVGTVGRDDRLYILGEKNGWYQIRSQAGRFGYVSKKYVRLE